MNSDLNLRAERQPAAVGMVGAVADLSRSNAAWVSVRDCTCSFAFHTRSMVWLSGGLGTSAERVTKRQRTRSAHLPLYLAGKRAAAESPLRKSHSIQFRQSSTGLT